MWIKIIFFIVACLVGLYFVFKYDSAFYDNKTGRWYKYAKKSDSPKAATCPRCRAEALAKKSKNVTIFIPVSPMIYSTSNKRHYGIYCSRHGEVWLDLQKKGDMK